VLKNHFILGKFYVGLQAISQVNNCCFSHSAESISVVISLHFGDMISMATASSFDYCYWSQFKQSQSPRDKHPPLPPQKKTSLNCNCLLCRLFPCVVIWIRIPWFLLCMLIPQLLISCFILTHANHNLLNVSRKNINLLAVYCCCYWLHCRLWCPWCCHNSLTTICPLCHTLPLPLRATSAHQRWLRFCLFIIQLTLQLSGNFFFFFIHATLISYRWV